MSYICRSCASFKHSQWRKSNPEIKKEIALRYSFGITLEQYNQLFTQQEGKCAICDKHQLNEKKALAVDHDHSNGVIRGLLCQNCNKGIGNLQDSIEILESSIEYLLTANTGLKVKGNQ